MSLSIATKGLLTGAVYQLMHKSIVQNKVRGSDLAKALRRVENAATAIHQDGIVLDPYVKSSLKTSLDSLRITLIGQNSAVFRRKMKKLDGIDALVMSLPTVEQTFPEKDRALIRAAYRGRDTDTAASAHNGQLFALTSPGLAERYGQSSTA
ncbi:hypothetical protein LGM46_03485 [Burkholderia arboris]|uniref:Uncharacterized protein n=1 Tax=Burkholderia metallica TaxID=488729 RepID=A0ABT8PJ69_9BURK|nr:MULTISPECIES: hypothetical protein [Burkholderia cepacia complex]MCA8032028.1 hypothetical protein [Burkholderia arboris]MDN7935199.1 hypothetical protein [Burkholderia metallica]